ncbi:unnamed protein product [Lactuca saligna]|uniref:Uncharacterized protein n=1 Tax=Lactuca saligna TaxID=75948 RepID=A0AA35VQE4_LACSI|nr:unnamed protein product [Lactuca saligna]
MNQLLHSSLLNQLKQRKIVTQKDDPNDDEIMVSFANLEFDPEEENVPDNMIMSSKQFRILNNKINSLLQIQLRYVAKELHDLFVEQVSKVKEYVDLKMVKLKSEIAKEVDKMEKNYNVLYRMVNIVSTTIKKRVEFNTDYSIKLEEKSEKDSQVFTKQEEFLTSIKESISKADLSNQSSVS